MTLIIPGVHPGPMYPIGSSDLPSQLFEHFSKRGVASLIFHGISDHELNLPSKEMVQHYLSSVDRVNDSPSISSCSEPTTVSHGKATITGISFEGIALIAVTLSPYGMEDFPRTVRQRIASHAMGLGFEDVFIIDAHNSLGTIPTEEECTDVVRASQELLVGLKGAPRYPFKVGYAHSSGLNLEVGDEIGPAGLGAVVIEIKGNIYALITADSNNAARGLRERILEHYRSSSFKILEFCTSDTHFSAGKEMNVKGYSPLGTKTSFSKIASALDVILAEAGKSMHPSVARGSSVETQVKVFGPETLENFSKALDRVLNVVRWGGLTLVAVVIGVLMSLLVS